MLDKMKKIIVIVQRDDHISLLMLDLTNADIKKMRFPGRMNLLQLVCNEGAVKILEHLQKCFTGDEYAADRLQMVNHRDNHLGSSAIHFAAACGRRKVLEILTENF